MPRRIANLCLFILLPLAGCRGPIEIVTRDRVIVEIPPTMTAGPLVEMPVSGPDSATVKVALIDVDGVLLNMDMTGLYSLGENPVSVFREKLDRIEGDPCVRAVVVRINSYGGGVTASDVMWRDLSAFKERTGLPVVVCLMDVGTGGAYYLATAADTIIAHPTTITGGIGVIFNVYNLKEALAFVNMDAQPIKSGEQIDVGSSLTKLPSLSEEILQTIADEHHARFREVVLAARTTVDPAQADTFDGRVFTAQQALELGLIDAIGYLDDAIAAAATMGACPKAKVVLLHRCNDKAWSPYSISPNAPLQANLFPINLPGYDRAQMPAFLYLWQPEPMLAKAGGR